MMPHAVSVTKKKFVILQPGVNDI